MPWSCAICNDVFTRKRNYENHLLTKRHKKRADNNAQLFQCIGCQKSFSSKLCLDIHRKNVCTSVEVPTAQPVTRDDNENIEILIGKIVNEKIQENVQQLREKDEQLREKDKKIEQLEKQLSEKQTNINNCTINNKNVVNDNRTTNIYLNSFGNESFEFDAKKIMQYIVNQPNDYFCSMIDDVHFNEDHPENQNIKLTEKNGSKIEVFKDDYWQSKMAQEFLLDAIIKYNGIADDIAQSHVNTLQRKYPNQLRKYQKTADRIYGIDVEDGPKGVEDLVLKTRCVLINGTRRHHTKT